MARASNHILNELFEGNLPFNIAETTYTPLGYVQITDLSSVVSPNPPIGSKLAVVKVENFGIRYTDDGQDPTATFGMPIEAGDGLIYNAEMNSIKVIEQEPGAVLNILFYGVENATP